MPSPTARSGRPGGDRLAENHLRRQKIEFHATLLAGKLPEFLKRHPDIVVEVNVDDGLTDIVAFGFGAGIRLDEAVEKDMIAVRIGYRAISSGTLMPWDYEKDGQEIRQQVNGPPICNSSELALAVVRSGRGVGWHMERDVEEDVRAGRLEQVLEDWSQPYDGAHLYHSSRRQVPPPLRALIDYLKE